MTFAERDTCHFTDNVHFTLISGYANVRYASVLLRKSLATTNFLYFCILFRKRLWNQQIVKTGEILADIFIS